MRTLYFLTFILLSFSGLELKASHIAGGSISYQWISGNSYLLQLNIYRDCGGVPAPSSVMIHVSSQSCIDSFSVNLPLVDSVDISPSCSGYLSTCSGGNYPGYQLYTYIDTVYMPQNCSDWIFDYSVCCRPPLAVNIVSPGTEDMFLQSHLDNLTTPFNNLSTPDKHLIDILYNNGNYTLDYSITDIDGDSISYQLIAPMTSGGQAISYQAPFTSGDPFNSGIFSLDSSNGNMSFTLNQGVMELDYALMIIEWRNINGAMLVVGYSVHDLQYLIINGATNKMPTLSGLWGGQDYSTSVCAGDSASFTIIAFDADTTDTLSFELLDSLPNVNINVSGNNPLNINVMWFTDTNDIQPQPHLLKFRVTDNKCIDYSVVETYSIYVSSCDTASVWPGDTDNDKSVTVWDILPIGVAYGLSGSPRNPANSSWSAQTAPINWGQQFNNGLDYKFADCDGNGFIDTLDILVVNQNMHQVHQFLPPSVPLMRNTEGDLCFSSIDTAYFEGQNIEIPITLGRLGQAALEAYAVAFSVKYDPSIVKSNTTDFRPLGSWLSVGMSTSLLDLMTVTFNNDTIGRLDVAISRIDGQDVIGNGEIGRMITIMEENIAGNTLQLEFENITVIDKLGDIVPIESFTYTADVLEDSLFSQISVQQGLNIRIYPNPALNKVYVRDAFDTELSVYDLFGRKCIVKKLMQDVAVVDINRLGTGIYLFEFRGKEGVYKEKIIVK